MLLFPSDLINRSPDTFWGTFIFYDCLKIILERERKKEEKEREEKIRGTERDEYIINRAGEKEV